MNIMQTNIFTGIPEMDTHILKQLDSKSLYNACQINSYAAELCWNNKKLRNRHILEMEKHGQYVLNPNTGRKILVGGKVYKQLLEEAMKK